MENGEQHNGKTASIGAGTEIRIHGIGDHNPWSALGTPPVKHHGTDFTPDTVLPPELPTHNLWLVTWSRVSRKRAGWLWYVALPFTLVNVAREMRSADRDVDDTGSSDRESDALVGAPPAGDTLLRVAVVVVGAVLTWTCFVWSVAIVETIARDLIIWSPPGPTLGQWIATAVAGGMAIGMWLRSRVLQSRGQAVASGILWFQVVVVGVGCVLAWQKPAHWQWSPGDDWAWLVT